MCIYEREESRGEGREREGGMDEGAVTWRCLYVKKTVISTI